MPRRDYKTLDLAAWEAGVGSPADTWKGRCHEIAILGIKAGLVKGFPAYGHYRGNVAKGSFFHANELNIQRHGWVRTPSGLVVDPTRWVFQNVEPYIFVGELAACKEYDEGGNEVRAMLRSPCPPFDVKPKKGKTLTFWETKIFPEIEPRLRDRLYGLLGDADGMTNARLIWLANHSPEEIGLDLVKPFYMLLKELGHSTFVPQDNWRRVMAMRKKTKEPA